MIYFIQKRKCEATGGLVVITREYHLADWNKSTFCLRHTRDSTEEDQKKGFGDTFNNNYSPLSASFVFA